MSDKNKELLSKRNLGNNYNLGKKASEETKLKISKSKIGNKSCLGRTIPEDVRNKIRISNKGKTRTDETKRKLSEAKIKIILNLENGVFSIGTKEASSMYSIELSNLVRQLSGKKVNKTNLLYV